MIRIIVSVITLSVSVAATCPPCDPSTCPKEPERDCLLGPVPDPCECCSHGVCGLDEGHPCYNASVYKDQPDKRRLGACAPNMLCIPRDDLGPGETETVCKCAEARAACGSDNKTYDSTCKMIRSEKNTRVTLQHWGPCHHTPQVTSGPENKSMFTGQPAVLDCEAKGFPVPSITWEFVSGDSSVVVLPGDNPLVSVQSRGGPESLMVSSWVQIQQARKSDSGTYSCVASNSEGTSRAVAQLSVQ
ncbi:insulin-like growth factor-binding protein-related protein 1 [Macrosteles quadrilineatus]|uniref:insulin-like growth factor-binding protein-related protein 1 n=1 Tax=Macrosteles quadrilineatus TaxID=74068 RepID=UPI0023E26658|nr:insulin-like growth factor-binding protein-related protein 1 [Macrosteles quadrilineatus]